MAQRPQNLALPTKRWTLITYRRSRRAPLATLPVALVCIALGVGCAGHSSGTAESENQLVLLRQDPKQGDIARYEIKSTLYSDYGEVHIEAIHRRECIAVDEQKVRYRVTLDQLDVTGTGLFKDRPIEYATGVDFVSVEDRFGNVIEQIGEAAPGLGRKWLLTWPATEVAPGDTWKPKASFDDPGAPAGNLVFTYSGKKTQEGKLVHIITAHDQDEALEPNEEPSSHEYIVDAGTMQVLRMSGSSWLNSPPSPKSKFRYSMRLLGFERLYDGGSKL